MTPAPERWPDLQKVWYHVDEIFEPQLNDTRSGRAMTGSWTCSLHLSMSVTDLPLPKARAMFSNMTSRSCCLISMANKFGTRPTPLPPIQAAIWRRVASRTAWLGLHLPEGLEACDLAQLKCWGAQEESWHRRGSFPGCETRLYHQGIYSCCMICFLFYF